MEMHRTGRTVAFSGGISVLSWGSIGGKLEGQGPLGSYFDEIETDSFCGQASWEKAESIFQQRALGDRKSTRLNSSHDRQSRMPSSA